MPTGLGEIDPQFIPDAPPRLKSLQKILDDPDFQDRDPLDKRRILAVHPEYLSIDPAQKGEVLRMAGAERGKTLADLEEVSQEVNPTLAKGFAGQGVPLPSAPPRPGGFLAPVAEFAFKARGSESLKAGLRSAANKFREFIPTAPPAPEVQRVPTDAPRGQRYVQEAQAIRESIPPAQPGVIGYLGNLFDRRHGAAHGYEVTGKELMRPKRPGSLPDIAQEALEVAGMAPGVLEEWLATIVQEGTSLATLASIPLGPLGTGVKAAFSLALLGKIPQAAKVLRNARSLMTAEEAVAMTSAAAVSPFGGALRGPTTGEVLLGPLASRAGQAVASAGEKIAVPAGMAEWIRSKSFPTGLTPPRGPASLTQVTKELMQPAQEALSPAGQAATHVFHTNVSSMFQEADQLGRELVERLPDRGQRGMPGGFVDEGILRMRDAADQGIVPAETQLRNLVSPGVGPAVPAETVAVAYELAERFSNLADRMVRAGVPESVVSKYKRAWMGRFYQQREIPLALPGTKVVFPQRAKQPSVVSGPQAARLMRRGEGKGLKEIKDVAYRAVKSQAQEGYIVSFMEYQKDLIRTEASRVSRAPVPGWIQLSQKSSKLLHPSLRGQYVHPDVARNLYHYDQVAQEMSNGNPFRKAMGYWRKSVTSMQLPVHAGNAASNFLVLDMKGIGNPATRPFWYGEVGKDYLSGGGMMAEAQKRGVFDHGFDARTKSREFLGGILQEAQSGNKVPEGVALSYQALLSNPPGVIRQAINGMDDLYRSGDEVFRYAAYKHYRESGMPAQMAAMQARKVVGDNRKLPVAWKRFSQHPLSPVPFVSWQYSMTPEMIKAVAANPQAYARWSHFLDAWNEKAAEELGIDPDYLRKFKVLRIARQQRDKGPEWIKTLGMHAAAVEPMMLIPRPMATGEVGVLGVGRFIPPGQAIAGRVVSLSPYVTGVAQSLTGKRFYGLQSSPMNAEGIRMSWPEVGAEALRLSGMPTPMVQRGLKAILQSEAEFNDPLRPASPTNAAGKALMALYGQLGLGALMGAPRSARVEAISALIASPQVINPAQEEGSAAAVYEQPKPRIPTKAQQAMPPEEARLTEELERRALRVQMFLQRRKGIASTVYQP